MTRDENDERRVIDHARIWQRITEELGPLPDQFIGIVCCSYFETMIADLCISVSADKRLAREKFGRGGRFSQQLEFLALSGIISEGEQSRLRALAAIRNKFAHEPFEHDFSSKDVRAKINELRFPPQMIPPADFPFTSGDEGLKSFLTELPEEDDYKGWYLASVRALQACIMARELMFGQQKRGVTPADFKRIEQPFFLFEAFGEAALQLAQENDMNDAATGHANALAWIRRMLAHMVSNANNRGWKWSAD